MATTFNGTRNKLSDDLIPSGYTRPTVTSFSVDGSTYIGTKIFTMSRATVGTVEASSTLTSIFNNGTVGLNKQVEDYINAEFDDAAKTITAWADLIEIGHEYDRVRVDGLSRTAYLSSTNQNNNYICKVRFYVKVV